MQGRSLAVKRINKDIKEITENPLEGIGICSLGGDIMKYVVNIKLMDGPYKDYCVQFLLTFPETYPSEPPKILIFPNQAIDGQYHHHIFVDSSTDKSGKNFKKFCFDLLDNDFMSVRDEYSGWNPGYTISSLLMQVQNFISDPDMHGYIPPKEKIDKLMDSMKVYSSTYCVLIGDKLETVTHTWNKPFPEIFEKKKDKMDIDNYMINENIKKEKERMQQIKYNLTCFMLKMNYIDDPDILLGYPIIENIVSGKTEKIELYPIPELLSYDGYKAQTVKQDNKIDYYFGTTLKSANNQFYNYWVPIYIDEKHYNKNKTTILNSFNSIKYGSQGLKNNDFNPEKFFEILPIILNKMIIGMYNGKAIICSSFIICYFHYVLLFKRLCLEYEKEYCKYVNHLFELIYNNNNNPDKSIIPDIGNFLMLLFFSNVNIQAEKIGPLWKAIIEEFFIRQPFWIFHEKENKIKMKNILFNGQYDKNDEYLYESFRVEEILKKKDNNTLNEVLKFAFDSQRGNKLLLISFLTSKKMKDEAFIKELKNNYGVFLGVDDFIKEIKQTLKTIDSYKKMYEYVGIKLGDNKQEIDELIYYYEKAKEKNYIKVHHFMDNNSYNYNNHNNYNNYYNNHNNYYNNHNNYYNNRSNYNHYDNYGYYGNNSWRGRFNRGAYQGNRGGRRGMERGRGIVRGMGHY